MTKIQEKRKNAILNTTKGKHSAVFFTVGGNGMTDLGTIVQATKSFKACASYLKRNTI